MNWKLLGILCLATLAWITAPSNAFAKDAVSFFMSQQAPVGGEAYCNITINEPMKSVKVTVTKGKRKIASINKGKVSARTTLEMRWVGKKAGLQNYNINIDAETVTGATVSGVIPFSVEFGGGLTLIVPKERADLPAGKIYYSTNQAFKHLTLKVFSKEKSLLLEKTIQYPGKHKDLSITWKPTAEPVGMIELIAEDGVGSTAIYKLIPFRVEIPHEEVIFESNSDKIGKAERPKLDKAIKEIKRQREKWGEDFPASAVLLVEGHTDTVGSADKNKALSARRAKSIARYFRSHGIKLPVHYKGMGEERLRIKTPDSTDEARNRRADYILSDSVNGSGWKRSR